jgi:hypothetical protein
MHRETTERAGDREKERERGVARVVRTAIDLICNQLQ